jgi:hypothetical protein
MEKVKAEAEAVAELVHSEPVVVNVMDPMTDRIVPVLVVPDKMKVSEVRFETWRDAPLRRKGTATAGTLQSFIDLVKRNENPDSAVFATRVSATILSLTAVIDYSGAGAEGKPKFGQHRVTYAFPVSEEWKLWQQYDGQQMSQEAFAEFIEARIADLGDPAAAGPLAKAFSQLLACAFASPSRVLELSRGLSIRVDSTVGASVNLSSGEKQLTYTEAHNDEAGKPIKVPGAFLLSIPVFVDDGRYAIPVRLTYKIMKGVVVWTYSLFRADVALDHAFTEAVTKVESAVTSKIYFGTPES